MTDLIGKSLGRYQILEPLGEGGMASVYKAYDTRLERDVAIKVIRVDRFASASLERILRRFEREAKALARLTHPNIVHINDYGEQDGTPYLVMDYLPGGTLRQHLEQAISWKEAIRLLLPIAEALDYAHSQGIIHRDIKPSNIMLTVRMQPMLTDFGIAKVIDEESTMDLTGTNATIGTPDYMAPEQAVSRNVDFRADIYSLGIVLYEMVTGHKPFQADTPMAVILMQASEPLPSPKQFAPGLPEAVVGVLSKALAKKPEDRYQTMAEFAKAMEQLLAGEETAEKEIQQPQQSQPGTYPGKSNQATVVQTQIPSARSQEEAQPPVSPEKQAVPLVGIKTVIAKPQVPYQYAPRKTNRRFATYLTLALIGFALVIGVGYLAVSKLIKRPPVLNTPFPTSVVQVNELPTQAFSPIPTVVPAASSTAAPTVPSSPNPESTSVNISIRPMFTASQPMYCRDGPAQNYDSHWQLNAGETAPVLAKWYADPSWLLVGINNSATRTQCCWVGGSGQLNVSLDTIQSTHLIPNRMDCSAFR
jgi:serine/threonine-protein kinase